MKLITLVASAVFLGALSSLMAQESSKDNDIDQILSPLRRGIKVEVNPPATNVQETSLPNRIRSQDGVLELAVNNRVFHDGDLMSIKVKAKEGRYLRLFHKDANDQIHQIFPNQKQQDNWIPAGEEIEIPSQDAGFQFRVTKPYGDEVLLAIATESQVSESEFRIPDNSLFRSFGGLAEVSSALRRGIRVTVAETRSGEVNKENKKESPESVSHAAIGVKIAPVK